LSEEEGEERERREMAQSDVEEVWVARIPSPVVVQEAWASLQLTGRLCRRGKGLAAGEMLPLLPPGLVVQSIAAAQSCLLVEEHPGHVWPLCLQDC
jgi:hypothetical protein